jgi:hypothetical protein
LRKRGVKCDDVIALPGMVTYANFYDPDGNRLQITVHPAWDAPIYFSRLTASTISGIVVGQAVSLSHGRDVFRPRGPANSLLCIRRSNE